MAEAMKHTEQALSDEQIASYAGTIKHDLYWKGSVMWVDALVAEIRRLKGELELSDDALATARAKLIENGYPDLPFLCDGIQNAINKARTENGPVEELVDAVTAAKEMTDWFMEHSRQADHAHSELGQPLHETAGWKELIDSGYNGLMASHTQQFDEALARYKATGQHAEPPVTELAKFAAKIARMTQDGEEVDGRELVMENDDAVTTLNELIEEARGLTEGRSPVVASFQDRVKPWMDACFGPAISADKVERNHRFLEEALELVQACGASREECLQLVEYVYGRPTGAPRQESGGVSVTHAALCLANGIDMHEAAEGELARVWTKIDVIRAKQAAKPRGSVLPVSPSYEAK